jgi:hypothetical protein
MGTHWKKIRLDIRETSEENIIKGRQGNLPEQNFKIELLFKDLDSFILKRDH